MNEETKKMYRENMAHAEAILRGYGAGTSCPHTVAGVAELLPKMQALVPENVDALMFVVKTKVPDGTYDVAVYHIGHTHELLALDMFQGSMLALGAAEADEKQQNETTVH